MKSKQLIGLLILLISFLTLSSCQFKEVKVQNIESIGIENISENSVTINLATKINNPNTFSFKISDVDLDLKINKIHLGTVNKIKTIKVKRKSNDIHHLIFEFEVDNILEKTAELLPSILSGKAHIQVKGYIKATHFPFSKKVNVNYHQSTQFFKN